MPTALGIESSCDDTCVSLVNELGRVLFNGSQNQGFLHGLYGGVVPELAGRNHTLHLLPLIREGLKVIPVNQIDVIAVTGRPGLLSSLLTGYVTAQALGAAWNKPVVGVNHIEGHILSPFLFLKEGEEKRPEYPALALIVSGGHSCLFYREGEEKTVLLGGALDDSAGEALDKLARLLGLGFPGGPKIEREAKKASFPRKKFFSKIQTQGLSFSFSGIKSAGRRLIESHSSEWLKENRADICADYQEVLVDHLMEKLNAAFRLYPVRQVVLGGGVSANGLLRARLKKWAAEKKVERAFPAPAYCTDNGAMIALTGLKYFMRGVVQLAPCSPGHLKEDFFSPIT